ncbi:unnamed protein product [Symbiodinium sp. CCMP2592]|nr:unnamed protein product [Symbiodinium sp. CCMP2592]
MSSKDLAHRHKMAWLVDRASLCWPMMARVCSFRRAFFTLIACVLAWSSWTQLQWQVESDQDGWRVFPSEFNGCTKIFLDVGANRATHIRKLFEPEKYNESRYLPIFDEAFGSASFRSMPSAATGLCAFGFEPNPRWGQRLHEIEHAYNAKGWRVQLGKTWQVFVLELL